jgi:peptidoglycan-associated lipoprotein
MRLKAFCLLAAVSILAACSSTPDTAGGAAGGANAENGIRAGSQQDLVAQAGDRVFFAYDHSDITPEGRATLEKQAAWMKKNASVTVTVEGHCDERGTREYNLALGERRANSVANYLTALGIDKSRISTISYGKERPICTDSNEACYSQNRRGVSAINQ